MSLTLLFAGMDVIFKPFFSRFLLLIFAIHRTAEEGQGYFFNSSLPFPSVFHTHLDT